jgi:hypothetical protein
MRFPSTSVSLHLQYRGGSSPLPFARCAIAGSSHVGSGFCSRKYPSTFAAPHV